MLHLSNAAEIIRTTHGNSMLRHLTAEHKWYPAGVSKQRLFNYNVSITGINWPPRSSSINSVHIEEIRECICVERRNTCRAIVKFGVVVK